MKTVRTIAALRRVLAPIRQRAAVALVPTMGAWHEGHLALIRAARRGGYATVASIFVNPAQFNDPEDLVAYPRDDRRDARMAADEGLDVLFLPAVEEIYPSGFDTWIDIGGAANGIEGALRPGHFRGVATVCLKLFTIVNPTVSVFGQKDAQQVAVIEQLVRDLNVPVQIRVVPTVRDADGLALSSRNARLSPEERRRALAIPRALQAGFAEYVSGGNPVAAARQLLTDLEVDYVTVADFGGRPTLAIAARVGRTRLIDNVRLDRQHVAIDGHALVQESQHV
jgi:pantoate--beta-alanine ligase